MNESNKSDGTPDVSDQELPAKKTPFAKGTAHLLQEIELRGCLPGTVPKMNNLLFVKNRITKVEQPSYENLGQDSGPLLGFSPAEPQNSPSLQSDNMNDSHLEQQRRKPQNSPSSHLEQQRRNEEQLLILQQKILNRSNSMGGTVTGDVPASNVRTPAIRSKSLATAEPATPTRTVQTPRPSSDDKEGECGIVTVVSGRLLGTVPLMGSLRELSTKQKNTLTRCCLSALQSAELQSTAATDLPTMKIGPPDLRYKNETVRVHMNSEAVLVTATYVSGTSGGHVVCRHGLGKVGVVHAFVDTSHTVVYAGHCSATNGRLAVALQLPDNCSLQDVLQHFKNNKHRTRK